MVWKLSLQTHCLDRDIKGNMNNSSDKKGVIEKLNDSVSKAVVDSPYV